MERHLECLVLKLTKSSFYFMEKYGMEGRWFFLGNGFAYYFRVGGIIDLSIHDLNVTILA